MSNTLTLEITRRWRLRVTCLAGGIFDYVVDSDRELAKQFNALTSVPDVADISYDRYYGARPAGLLTYHAPAQTR
jgi:hypothetical protein